MKAKTRTIQTEYASYEDIGPSASNITACYVRVSTDTQAINGYGIETQIDELSRYCRSHSFENVFFFIDDGYTGTNTERPAYQSMLSLLRQDRLTRIVVMKIDRLGRSLRDIVLFFEDEIRQHNCAFVSLNPNFDTSDSTGKLILMLLATFAEMDHDNIVEKTQAGRRRRAMDGRWKGGGKIPYGYKYQNGELVIDEDEAERVKEVFRLYCEEKYPPSTIAAMLNFSGERVVSQILRNRTYIGMLKYKNEEYAGRHPVFLDRKLFDKAQERLAARHRVRGNSHYLLSSLVFCGCCGAKMRYQQWGSPNRHKLVCYSQQTSKPSLVRDENCANLRYDAEEVESAVIHEIFRFAFETSSEAVSHKERSEKIIASLIAKKKSLDQGLLKLYRRYSTSDNESDAVLEKAISEQKEAIAKMQRQINAEKESGNKAMRFDETKRLLETLPSTWESMSASEKQSIVREIVEKVELENGELRVFFRLADYFTSDDKKPPQS